MAYSALRFHTVHLASKVELSLNQTSGMLGIHQYARRKCAGRRQSQQRAMAECSWQRDSNSHVLTAGTADQPG